jgi:hypothetical protein
MQQSSKSAVGIVDQIEIARRGRLKGLSAASCATKIHENKSYLTPPAGQGH